MGLRAERESEISAEVEAQETSRNQKGDKFCAGGGIGADVTSLEGKIGGSSEEKESSIDERRSTQGKD